MAKSKTSLADLTWADLEAWAGSKIVSRGKSYKSHVSDPGRTEDGAIIAWVQGTGRYATQVAEIAKEGLVSTCSCPYDWGPCKHAVALILVYLDMLKAKETLPLIASNDPRMRRIARAQGDVERMDTDADWDEEDEPDDGVEGDEAAPEASASRRRSRSGPKSGRGADAKALTDYLSSLQKDDLIKALQEAMGENPALRRRLSDRQQLKDGQTDKLVESVRAEIHGLAAEEPWADHWSGRGHIPDYSGVATRLEALLRAGRSDAVIALGRELFELGTRQVGRSNDDGMTAFEIGQCMAIVGRALRQSSSPPSERILWIIQCALEDEYSLFDGLGCSADDLKAAKSDWAIAARWIEARLNALPQQEEGSDSFHRRFERRRTLDWLIMALERSGRAADVIPLLEREAEAAECYELLIDRLLADGRMDEAKARAMEGFQKMAEHAPGFAWGLEGRLRTMAEKAGDTATAAAFCALEFFEHPNIETYRALEKASRAVGVWPDVRLGVLGHLETGQRPDWPARQPGAAPAGKRSGKKGGGASKKKTPAWPLPGTGLTPPPKRWASQFPDCGALIDIAIYEKRLDDALHWHARSNRNPWGRSARDLEVARAVEKTHPDVAIEIWKREAERHIAMTKPAAYYQAADCLKRARAIYLKGKRKKEWEDYLTNLRAGHKAKRRLMEVLDGLEGKRIIDA